MKIETVLFVKKWNFWKNGSLAELWGLVTDSSNWANIQKLFWFGNLCKKNSQGTNNDICELFHFCYFFYVCLSSSGLLIIGESTAVGKVWSGRSGEQTWYIQYIYRMLLLLADVATVDPGSSGVKLGWGGGGGGGQLGQVSLT